ncbi:MAG TPA: aminotransferase class IV [Bacteroidales bacterium]
MNECKGKKYILNGNLQPAEMFDKSLVYEGDSVYEVLRMTKGNPIFFSDHMERLAMSVKLQKKKILADITALRNAIISLARSDKKRESNLKIVFNYNGGTYNWLIYYIEPIYPTEMQYRNGVKGILFFAERKDPESKVINHKLRSSIYHMLILESGYEAILVNENNLITEGSRSNIFFLKGETLVTAPDNVILNGITRKYILQICSDHNISVELSCVSADNISDYDAVFMTGTSPMVLPFNCIGDKYFNVRLPMVERLRKLYIEKAEASIGMFRAE